MRSVSSIVFCLLFAALLLSCGENDPFKDFTKATAEENGGRLTIMAYNVEDMDEGTGSTMLSVYAEIANILKASKVDVVCFQETQPGSGTSDKYGDGSAASDGDVSNFNKALKAAGYIMPYYAFNSDGSIRRDFVSVWSRFKVDSIVSIRQEGRGSFDPSSGNRYRASRPILRYRVPFMGHEIWFYGCHLKSNAGGVIEQNAGSRRAQAFHLMRYIMRHHDPERDLIVVLGDMNTMPSDYDNSGNSTIDYLCLKYDNPFNVRNDFIPVNLDEIGAVTNAGFHPNGDVIETWGAKTMGTTHAGNANGSGYPDATFDHIILSPTLYNVHYVPGSINIIRKSTDYGGGPADHFPVLLTLDFN